MPSPAIPPLNALWRPNETGPSPKTREDRELIRQAASYPATELGLFSLTEAMNDLARVSPATVAQIQRWINEIEELQSIWSGKVLDGTAHHGNVDSYEGPIPGRVITEDDRESKLGPIEKDTSLLKVKLSGGGAAATEGAVTAGRIAALQERIVEALGIRQQGGGMSCGRLLRS
jgi:hypothetical protein